MLFDVLIVIIKQGPPRAVPNMENVVIAEQLAQEECQYAGPANTDHDQVNDDMELDDDHDDNIVEDDGVNTLACSITVLSGSNRFKRSLYHFTTKRII